MARGSMHSEQTAREIDEEVRRIVDDSIEKVRGLLESRRPALEALTKALMDHEVIDGAEMRRIIEETAPGPWIVPGTTSERKRDAVPIVEAPEPREQARRKGRFKTVSAVKVVRRSLSSLPPSSCPAKIILTKPRLILRKLVTACHP